MKTTIGFLRFPMFRIIPSILCFLVVVLVSQLVFAFKSKENHGHFGITFQALSTIEYRTSTGSILRFSPKAIREVQEANASVDDPFMGEFSKGHAHFDSELLLEGSKRLIDFREIAIMFLTLDPPDGKAARGYLGRALHTLQDFYSHSNWVNLPDNFSRNYDLGKKEIKPLGGRTNWKDIPTCVDDFWDGTLTGAGLSDLTTGYFPLLEGDYEPPPGKCIHGLVPGAGIHKDTPGRPFYEDAFAQAVASTIDYIDQILKDDKIANNDEALKSFFDIHGSLGFVIDDTGSMGPTIDGVKSAVARIVREVEKNPDKRPDQYLLVRYGDPDVGIAFTTSSAENILSAVNAFSPHGGGDCPELAMAALLNAINAANEESTLHLFTDASAKDAGRVGSVVARAIAKNIIINVAGKASCSPVDPVYKKITTETGGQLVVLENTVAETENYFNIVLPSLTGDLQPILIINRTITDSGVVNARIPVDSTMTGLVISVDMDKKSTIELFRPNGTEVIPGDSDAEVTELSSGRVINMSSPVVGEWKLRVAGDSGVVFSASVMGNSTLSFDRFDFVELGGRLGHECLFPIAGQPVVGPVLTAAATLFGPFDTVDFDLITEDGTFIERLDMSQGQDGAADEDFVGTFDLPAERFRVYARGKDESGADFMRVIPSTFLGQSVKVEPLDNFDSMIAAERFTAHFKVTNHGADDTFTISVEAGSGLGSSVSPNEVTLASNDSAQLEVVLNVPADTPAETAVTLTVVATSTTDSTIENSTFLTRAVVGASDGDGDPNSGGGGGGGGGCFVSTIVHNVRIDLP